MGSPGDPLPRTNEPVNPPAATEPRGSRSDVRVSGPPASPTSLAAALSTAAEQLLEQAKSGPPTRDTALTILAADALITFACEAAGEADPSSLAELW